jgi:SAM-dependent methyltransferase
MSQAKQRTKDLLAEAAYWKEWLTAPSHEHVRTQRLKDQRRFPKYLLDAIQARPGQTIRAIDVGSGPVSTLGTMAPDFIIDLICVDVLAESFNIFLREVGIHYLPHIVEAKGEELVERFGVAAFDVVHSANALDHFEDPALAFDRMCSVCRPGGVVVVIAVENDGEKSQYHGLHKWNLRADEKGLWLWTPNSTRNLLDLAKGFRFDWQYVPGTAGARVIRAKFVRRT